MKSPIKKPVVRVLHHMARSGGTVISRCLGSMDGVVLLSEIHPFGSQVHNPLQQASEWFHLFTDAEMRSFSGRTFTFIDVIEMIRKRVEESGSQLVIRDWSHLDFTGIPFIEHPSYKLTTADILSQRYHVIQTATVRHPVDQWISLNKLTMFQSSPKPQLKPYIYGYLRFAEYANKMGYLRFEDFTVDSDVILQRLSENLHLPFDVEYRNKWKYYEKITGENTTPSEYKRTNNEDIEVLSRQISENDLVKRFACDEYFQALELLGYEDV